MVPYLLMLVLQVPALWRSLVPQAAPPHRALVPLVLDTAKLPERLGSRALASHHSEKGGVLSAIWTYGQTDQPVIVTFDGALFWLA